MSGVYRQPPFPAPRRPGFEPALDPGTASVTLAGAAQPATAAFTLTQAGSVALAGTGQAATAAFTLTQAATVAFAGAGQSATSAFTLAQAATVAFAGAAQAATAAFTLTQAATVAFAGVGQPATSDLEIIAVSVGSAALEGAGQPATAAFAVGQAIGVALAGAGQPATSAATATQRGGIALAGSGRAATSAFDPAQSAVVAFAAAAGGATSTILVGGPPATGTGPLDALEAAFLADADATAALPGGLWKDKAGDQARRPFAVATFRRGNAMLKTNGYTFYDDRITLRVVAEDSGQADAAAGVLITTLVGVPLEWAGGFCVPLYLAGSSSGDDPAARRGAGGGKVYWSQLDLQARSARG